MLFRETPWGQQSPPPWSFPGTVLRGFALPASFGKLLDWCDTMLNGVGDSSFVPALPAVFLYVAHYPKMIADAWAQLGYSVQNEYFIMFPVIRSLGGVIPIEFGWTIPFIGVDNGTSAISAQTEVGLPKTLGAFTLTNPPDGSFTADVSMVALQTFSPASEARLHPLFDITADGPDPTRSMPLGGFPGVPLGFTEIDALIPAAVRDLFELPLAPPGQLSGACFGLRQIRDCGSPTEAALADIVRMRWRSENERDFRFWNDAQVDLFDNDTFPITQTLGLTGGAPLTDPSGQYAGLRYTPLAAWGMTLDMFMSAATLP